jgi:hypothetical protein
MNLEHPSASWRHRRRALEGWSADLRWLRQEDFLTKKRRVQELFHPACLDGLLARRRLSFANVAPGKTLIVRIVSMLSKLIDSVLAR